MKLKNKIATFLISISLLLSLLIVGFVGVVRAPPLPIGDASYKQTNPFDSNPTAGTYSGIGTPSGAITDAFDGDLVTNINFYYGASASGYAEVSVFKKPSDNGLTDFTINFVDIKVDYRAMATSFSDDQYRIVAYVDPSPTVIVLQDWVWGSDAMYPPGDNANPAVRTFSKVAEPNNGVWTWTDIANLRVRVEIQAVGTNNFQRVYLCEVWATAYSTPFPSSGTISVQPPVVTETTGGHFYIDIYVTGVTNMWGYEFWLNFDPAILMPLEYFSYGPFISALPSEIGTDYVAVAYKTYDGDPVGFTGDTPVTRIWFAVVADGISSLNFTRAIAADVHGSVLSLVPVDGIFTTGTSEKVDLSVSSQDIAFSDSNPSEGQLIAISANVHNVGETNLENVTVRFLDGATLIGEQKIPFISHHSQGTASIDWNPQNAGFHLIKVAVDPNDDIIETNEGNNKATRLLHVGTWQQGGIHLTGDISPKETNPCSTVEVSGKATYTTTYGAGEPVAGADITVNINGGRWNTYTIADGTYEIDVSAPLSPGNYTVLVMITDYTFWESIDLTLEVDAVGGLDLALSIIDVTFSPTSPVENDEVLVTAIVHNVGTESASNIAVGFYDNTQLVGETTISLLQDGSSEATGITWQAKPSGWHIIEVKIDPQNEIPETDENNNDASRTIYVYPSLPDLTPTSIVFSDSTPLINQNIILATQVTNIGGVYAFNVSVTFYNDGNFLGRQTIPSIPPKGGSETAQITSSFTSVGWHVVTVVVDPNNSVAEADEDNNALSTLMFVRLPSVDLALSSLDITFSNNSPAIGDTITINATIHNFGELNANNVVVEFFGIGNTTIPHIYSGSSMVANISWNATPAGLHWIVVRADPDNAIPESNENNNVASRGIYVSPPPEEPRPNLAVYSGDIVFSNTNPIPSENVTIYATVNNVGKAGAEDIPVVFYVDNVQIGSVCIIRWLSAGDSKMISTSWTASYTGTHIVEVKVDPWYSIVETSKSDNDASRTIYVYPSLPDLTPTSIVFSDSTPLINQNIMVSASVRNLGGVEASNVAVRFYDDGTPIGTITLPIVDWKGASETAEIVLTFASAGWHVVTVVVDPENNIAEADETNNGLSIFVFARSPSPDLALSSFDITFSNPTPTIGDMITISAEVHNAGEIEASNVVVEFFGIDRRTIALIPAGGSRTTSVSWTATPAGWHIIVVMADPDNAISESNENNNVAFRSIYVAPSGPPADLSVLSRDIVFSNANPVSGEEVTINATIHNVGQGEASEVVAIFYLDRVIPLGTQTIASILPGESQNVSVDWTATQRGSHVVTVLVDTPGDFNEDNNVATRAIIVFQPDFSMSVSCSSLSTNPGESTTCTITVTSLDSFSSTISLEASVNPNTGDVAAALNPTSVTLQAGGSAQSALTISTSSATPLKTFGITVTATGGGKTNTLTCAISVEVYLEVPYQNQGYAGWCALTSLAMSLRYYGKEFHSWDYAADENYPTSPTGLRYLITCDTLANYVSDHYPELDTTVGYYDMLTKYLLWDDIRSNITSGFPVILALGQYLQPPPLPGGHMIIVVGFNETGLFVNDPSGYLFSELAKISPLPWPYIHAYIDWSTIEQYIVTWPYSSMLAIKGVSHPESTFGTLYLTAHDDICFYQPDDYQLTKDHYELSLNQGLRWNHIGKSELDPVIDRTCSSLYVHVYVSNCKQSQESFTAFCNILCPNNIVHPLPFMEVDGVSAFGETGIYWRLDELDDLLSEGGPYYLEFYLSDSNGLQVDHFITEAFYWGQAETIRLEENQEHLFLHVYDAQGNHVGMNYTTNQTELGIPGSYYHDDLNGTIIIVLPQLTNITIVVDAKYAQQPMENYNLTITIVNNGQITDQNSTRATIQNGTQIQYNFEISQTGEITSVSVHYPGDVNNDGVVNIVDAAAISAHWYPGPPIGPLGFDADFDINNDGAIDILDSTIVNAYWTGPPKGPLAP